MPGAGKPAKKHAKSKKADGTPKARWSSSQRAERGHTPRRGGGTRPGVSSPYGEVSGREGRSAERRGDVKRDSDSRSTWRDGGSSSFAGGERERPRSDDRFSGPRDDRGRDDRSRGGQGGGSWGRSDQGVRGERPAWQGRDERPRTGYQGRDERGGSQGRDDRPRTGWQGRDDRAGRDERPGYQGRDDRPRTGGYQGRDDRPRTGYQGRDDRPRTGWQGRDDRPRTQGRDDRPATGYQGRDDRPRSGGYQGRDDRPRTWSQGRDDRPRTGGDAWGRDERPRTGSWGQDDSSAQGYRGRDDRSAPGRDDRSFGRGRDDRPHGRGLSPRAPYDKHGTSDRFATTDHVAKADRFSRGERSGPSQRPARGTRPDRGGWDRDRERSFDDQSGGDPDVMEWNPDAIDDTALTAAPATTSAADGAAPFGELGLAQPLVAALAAQGITTPFPIQAATIPDALAGRDVLGRGRTGSGKTLAFGLPLLTKLAQGPQTRKTKAMVLVPTRELALQVADVLNPLARQVKLSVVLVAGGMSYGPQTKAFDRGVDIVVATPGRLIDLLEQGIADLSNVQLTVLDEADQMADMGFLPAMRTLLDATPPDGQRLLFSATLDNAVGTLVRTYLHDPVTHEVDPDAASVTTMRHEVLLVHPADKIAVAAEIANREGRSVVFVRTQRGASRVAEQLRDAGVLAGALHGGLTQGARARMLAAFREGVLPVLVATDVAARGIHVDDVSLVLQLDPPMTSKDYLHRAGRTARAGEAGVVASLVLPHQRRSTLKLTDQAGVRVTPVSVAPGDERLIEITGSRAATNDPVTQAQIDHLTAPKAAAGRRPRPRHNEGPRFRQRREHR